MRLGLYPKLALDGILKNRRLYFPYIITAICMVMMEYIVLFLSKNKAIAALPGGDILSIFLTLGIVVIGVFAFTFLYYSHGFLMKKRKKEFGLYNILGMGKRHISIVVFWETMFIFLASLIGGLVLGISFSKVAQLGLLRLTKSQTDLSFEIPPRAIIITALVFFVIFMMILLNALRQVFVTNAINLLKSEAVGEKPPKANWVVGVLGFVILGIAYFLAVSVNNAVSAITFFFIAVLLVIVSTYLIMIFGSVIICRILKNNKSYYYKANHYVSVSSMAYRMKRNGAGLASICILSTMVLVMISTTSCLFFGESELLNARDPRQIVFVGEKTSWDLSDEEAEAAIDKVVAECGETATNKIRFSSVVTYGPCFDGLIYLDINSLPNSEQFDFGSVKEYIFITLDDYNRLNNTNETLSGYDCFVYSETPELDDKFTIYEGDMEFSVVRRLPESPVKLALVEAVSITKPVYIVVKDIDILEKLSALRTPDGVSLVSNEFKYYFDVTGGNSQDKETEIISMLSEDETVGSIFEDIAMESREVTRIDFFTSYGGLFFLGIILSIVFTLASVLIIYYKQISEGYEDQGRFEIMRKVGMTKKDIKKGINSQLLTVFFIPLVGALMHIAFAFPMITKLLLLFNLTNTLYFAKTTIICFVAFAAFYTIIYKITSNEYYKIVSSKLN